MVNIVFENDYRNKVLFQSFAEPTTLASSEDVNQWRASWTKALKSWHSPYKSLIDCQNLTVSDTPEVAEALERMETFLKGFFLIKAVCYGGKEELRGISFNVVSTLEEAESFLGIRQARSKEPSVDFRTNITLKNDFRLHVMELEFAAPVIIDHKDKMVALRSKVANNVMQWHSKWSLLIDCYHLDMTSDMKKEFQFFERYFRGFFLKTIVGYQPQKEKERYPFPVFRSRHKAVSLLESEGLIAGDNANCSTRK